MAQRGTASLYYSILLSYYSLVFLFKRHKRKEKEILFAVSLNLPVLRPIAALYLELTRTGTALIHLCRHLPTAPKHHPFNDLLRGSTGGKGELKVIPNRP